MTRRSVPEHPGEVWVYSDKRIAQGERPWRVTWRTAQGELVSRDVAVVSLQGRFISQRNTKGQPRLSIRCHGALVEIAGVDRDLAVIRSQGTI